MTPTRYLLALALLAAAALPAWAQDDASAPESDSARLIAIRAGKVLTMTGDPIDDGVVLVRGRTIAAVGVWGEVELPEGTPVVEMEDAWLTPGLIELHCHIGAGNYFRDLNDSVHQINAELRNVDVVLPGNERIQRALQGGVTSALFIPGSGSNMSGFGTLIKFAPERKDAILRFPGALKIAQAGNPERGSDFGAGRMGMNAMIREQLLEGKRYHEAWLAHEQGKGPQPEKQPRLEYLRGLYKKEYPILVHTQIMQVVHSTVRILHEELGLKPIISHASFDAFVNAEYMAKKPLHLNPGPRQVHIDRRTRSVYGLAERWHAGGIRDMSVCTDSPVLEQEDLFFQGTIGGYLGAPTRVMLEGLTIGAARALYIDKRIGSIQKGRDADMVLWTGDPLDPRSRVLKVWIYGKRVYDLKRDKGRY